MFTAVFDNRSSETTTRRTKENSERRVGDHDNSLLTNISHPHVLKFVTPLLFPTRTHGYTLAIERHDVLHGRNASRESPEYIASPDP
jgi:hypothetical protein